MQFQAICSKWNQKLTLSLTANSIEEARSILHGQGYSIMEIKEFSTTQTGGNFFYFDVLVNNQLKSGKIQSDDIFKSYKKLIEDLKYNVVYIYTNEWMPEDQKKMITAKVRDSYRLYKQSMGEDIDNIKIETQDEKDIQEISPQILKEIERYVLIIDSTIEKIQNLFLKYHSIVTPERKIQLEQLVQALLQAKGSSNLGKIRTITEQALTTVWWVEVELAKAGMNSDKKRLLEETNALLKQIGSEERVEILQPGSIDVGKSITSFFTKVAKTTNEPKKSEAKKVDTNSFIYYKNQRELNLYKENLNKNDIQIMKAILTFQFSKLKRLKLKKKLLSQNIQIIDNRINNKNISYTKIVHGFEYYMDLFISGINQITTIFTYALFVYIVIYITLQVGSYFSLLSYTYQPKAFLFITMFSVITLIFSFVSSMKVLWFAIPVVIANIIFFSINF